MRTYLLRSICSVLCCISCLFSSSYLCHAALPPDRNILVVAGDEYFPPYEFIDEVNGMKVYRGFNIDLLRSISLQTGYEIQFRPMSWPEALQALKDGEVDAIGGMKYDLDRTDQYDFSDEHVMINSQGIFVGKDTSIISGLGDLTGKRVAVQKGDNAHRKLEGLPIQLVLGKSQEEALQLLIDGKVDAVVSNKLAGQYILQRLGAVEKVKIVGGMIDPQRYCIAVRKGNTATLAIFNEGLRAVKKNGTYDAIYGRWFGETVDYPVKHYKQYLLIAVAIIFVGGLIIFTTASVNFVLKQEVKKRTRELECLNGELLLKNQYIKKADHYKEKILNSVYSGIVTFDQEGKVKFVNAYASCYFYKDKEIRDTMTVDGIIIGEELYRQIMDEPKKNGRLLLSGKHFEYTVDSLESSGNGEEIIIYFRDVTQEYQIQQELIRKDKMESLGTLVACIAHEIRNPLTSIKTFTELIPSKYENPAFREKISEFVPREIERLNSIVTDLLNYATPKEMTQEKITLKSLVDGTLVFFADGIGKQGITYTITLDKNATIYVDSQQIKQVIINIVLNALQALQGVVEPKLWIEGGYTEDKAVYLRIVDNGPGIVHGDVSKIFDPFFTTKPTGTGLGLFVSYQLAQQNGATITVESSETVGTTFSIIFAKTVGGEEHV